MVAAPLATMRQYPGPIVIFSPADDAHAVVVSDWLRARGQPVHLLDTRTFPRGASVTLCEELDQLEVDGVRIHPSSAYIRVHGPYVVTTILNRWDAVGVPIYNAPAAALRTTPPYQLGLLAAARVPVPRTRWTNDPATLRSSRETFHAAGTGTELRPLECVQQQLTGDVHQVYVVDGHVVASEPSPLSDAMRRICVRAANVLGLRFARVELRSDDHGLQHVVELDAFPSFLDAGQEASTAVLDALCGALARPFIAATVAADEPATTRGRKRSPT